MRTSVKFGPTQTEQQEQNAITLKWGRGRVALPISFLRSSLFAVNRQPKEWDEKKEIRMESPEGIYVAAKGPRLDQYDKLVYCSVLQICWQHDIRRNTEEKKYLKKLSSPFQSARPFAFYRASQTGAVPGARKLSTNLWSVSRLWQCLFFKNFPTNGVQFLTKARF